MEQFTQKFTLIFFQTPYDFIFFRNENTFFILAEVVL